MTSHGAQHRCFKRHEGFWDLLLVSGPAVPGPVDATCGPRPLFQGSPRLGHCRVGRCLHPALYLTENAWCWVVRPDPISSSVSSHLHRFALPAFLDLTLRALSLHAAVVAFTSKSARPSCGALSLRALRATRSFLSSARVRRPAPSPPPPSAGVVSTSPTSGFLRSP